MSSLTEVADSVPRRVYLDRIRELELALDRLRTLLKSREMELAHLYREVDEVRAHARKLEEALHRQAA